MIYEPDCVKKLLLLIILTGTLGIIYAVIDKIAQIDDEKKPGEKTEEKLYSVSAMQRVLLCIICSECVEILLVKDTGMLVFAGLLCIVAACILAGTVMDVETHMVYDYVWWIGGGAAVILLCLTRVSIQILMELLAFALLQEFMFARMYGRADCHAFVVCAVLGSAFGMGMKGYLCHMLCSFLMLAVIQLLKGNVSVSGNLKVEVPFLPYIAVSCWLSLVNVYLW